MLDEATIERIVREVIRRLLEVNPALFYEAGAGGGSGNERPGLPAGTASPGGGGSSPMAMNPLGTSSVSFSGEGLGRTGPPSAPFGSGSFGRSPSIVGSIGAGTGASALGVGTGASAMGVRTGTSALGVGTGTSSFGRELVSHHHGRVLTEFDLIMARRSGQRVLTLRRGTIVTPLAKDRAKDLGIELRYRD